MNSVSAFALNSYKNFGDLVMDLKEFSLLGVSGRKSDLMYAFYFISRVIELLKFNNRIAIPYKMECCSRDRQ